MNTFEFVQCSKNDVRVCSMFDKMVFDPSLLSSSSLWPLLCLMKHFSRRKLKLMMIKKSLLFDGNPEVITMIGCVTNDRLRESPPPEKCKHNASVVFEC